MLVFSLSQLYLTTFFLCLFFFSLKKITTEEMTSELTPDWISLSEQATVDSKAPGQSKLVAGSFQRGRFQVGITKSVNSVKSI